MNTSETTITKETIKIAHSIKKDSGNILIICSVFQSNVQLDFPGKAM